MGPRAKARLERLRTFRTRQAEALGLTPGLLLPTATLERLALAGPDEPGLLGELAGWRLEVLGDGLLATLRAE
jgi:ribonuclease D